MTRIEDLDLTFTLRLRLLRQGRSRWTKRLLRETRQSIRAATRDYCRTARLERAPSPLPLDNRASAW